jgi:hypothetical protein
LLPCNSLNVWQLVSMPPVFYAAGITRYPHGESNDYSIPMGNNAFMLPYVTLGSI